MLGGKAYIRGYYSFISPTRKSKRKVVLMAGWFILVALIERRKKYLKINELRDGARRVDIEANVIQKSETREVRSKFTNETYRVADATIEDETGTITLTLWNEQTEQVNVGDRVRIENGYIKSFRGELQLNSGKYGTLTVL
ncbi:MAG: OB-fold nucleic acid binding domain-containing protein [Candidatus Bathyarchaeota archaeon]|jgi:replication factor A1